MIVSFLNLLKIIIGSSCQNIKGVLNMKIIKIFYIIIIFFTNNFLLSLQDSAYTSACSSLSKEWYMQIKKTYAHQIENLQKIYHNDFHQEALIIALFTFTKLFNYLNIPLQEEIILEIINAIALTINASDKPTENKTTKSILLIHHATFYLFLIPHFKVLVNKYAGAWLDTNPYKINNAILEGPNLFQPISREPEKTFYNTALESFSIFDIYSLFKIFAIANVLKKYIS